mgnify:CR=1 FL=1
MRSLKEQLETSREINKVLINEVDRLAKELKMEVELHFETIESLLHLHKAMDALTNNKKPF